MSFPNGFSAPPPSPNPPPPTWLVSGSIATLSAMRRYVTYGSRAMRKPGRRICVRPPHWGQRTPTGVDTMHSGQIGRPQFWQWTAVSRSWWR